MDIYVMSREEPAMVHANSELLFKIIRATHDPDPLHADRYRPFAYPPMHRTADGTPWRPAAAFDMTRFSELVRKTAAALPAIVPFQRPAPTPLCPTLCC